MSFEITVPAEGREELRAALEAMSHIDPASDESTGVITAHPGHKFAGCKLQYHMPAPGSDKVKCTVLHNSNPDKFTEADMQAHAQEEVNAIARHIAEKQRKHHKK